MISDFLNWSEEDIRTKIVCNWLADHGLSASEISLEFSFEIRIGRHVWKVGAQRHGGAETGTSHRESVRPRADVLVRRLNKNLMIIEVKAPDEPLDDDARDQGISYARLLPDIAPFVVLTNGRETRIFDSVTRKELHGQSIPATHPHARAGFRVSLDDLQLRSEALELFLSLSPENLLIFCQTQASFRMARLRGDDPESGKKYIPPLYVGRASAEKRLLALLEEPASRVVAVVGRPQVGKTNFICHLVEQQIACGQPCLFYPAISLENGLLQELHADFGWLHHDASPSVPVLVDKLRRVLTRAQTTLILFIDGWNEADVDVARRIDQECERLACHEIRIVVSFTNMSAQRLLSFAGNPSFIQEGTGIGPGGAQLIESDPLAAGKHKRWRVVSLDCFSDGERAIAYETYARHFSVTVPPSHVQTSDPYLLAVAMRHYRSGTLPMVLDEPQLLERWLCERINRACEHTILDIRASVTELGRAMVENEPPLDERTVKIRWGLPVAYSIPPSLFDAAILSLSNVPGMGPAIDFYNARDRSFVIACWAGQWPSALGPSGETLLETALKTEAGREGLTWFFQLRQTQLELLPVSGPPRHFANPQLRRLFLRVLASQSWQDVDRERRHTRIVEENTRRIVDEGGVPRQWHLAHTRPEHTLAPACGENALRSYAMNVARTDPDILVRIEAFVLVAALTNDENKLAALAPDDTDLDDLVLRILQVHQEYPLSIDSPGAVLLKALRRIHGEDYDAADEHDSQITDVLSRVAKNERSARTREAAVACLGYLIPNSFLSGLGQRPEEWSERADCGLGIANALSRLEDEFFGDDECSMWCHGPSYLEDLASDPRRAAKVYEKLFRQLAPIMRLAVAANQMSRIHSLLKAVGETIPPDMPGGITPPRVDAPGQMHLPFGE